MIIGSNYYRIVESVIFRVSADISNKGTSFNYVPRADVLKFRIYHSEIYESPDFLVVPVIVNDRDVSKLRGITYCSSFFISTRSWSLPTARLFLMKVSFPM